MGRPGQNPRALRRRVGEVTIAISRRANSSHREPGPKMSRVPATEIQDCHQFRSYPLSSCRISSSACISLRPAASRLSVSALRLPS